MRICQVTDISFTRLNGHAVVVDQLARQYLKLGHETVTVAQGRNEPVIEAFAQSPYRIARYQQSRFAFLERFRMRRALVDLRREWPFDVIHCHSAYAPGYVALALCSQWGVPLAISSQGSDLAPESRLRRHAKTRARLEKTLTRADALIAISPFIREQQESLASKNTKNIREIPNGVDFSLCATPVSIPKQQWEIFQQKPFVLFLGRLHRRKGVSFLIEAFSEIATKIPEAQLVIAGDGVEAETLKNLASHSAFSSRIHFIGVVSGVDKLWLLQNARCVAVPTISWEGQPLVAIEAMAAGQWVIGTQVGGIIGLIRPGIDGSLVPPSNARELSAAMLPAFQNPGERQRISIAAREQARRHDWENVARMHVALFAELIARQPKVAKAHSI